MVALERLWDVYQKATPRQGFESHRARASACTPFISGTNSQGAFASIASLAAKSRPTRYPPWPVRAYLFLPLAMKPNSTSKTKTTFIEPQSV
jgi:hypothetical protein